MAIKKKKKAKNKNNRVEQSSSSPPKDAPKKASSNNSDDKAPDRESKPKEGKPQTVNAQNTATKEPEPKPPPKPKAKEADKGLTGIASYIEFLKQVRIEYKKITWPDRRQIVQETWTVLILVTFITLLVLGYDWVLGNLVFGPLEHWIKINIGP